MTGLLLRFLFGFFGLWLAAHLVHGITYASVQSLAVAAILLGVINAIVRPIVIVLTLPLTIVTLGLFLLVINALMLVLTAHFLHGFNVHGFVAAFWGSIVVSIVSWVGHAFARER
jgi:putative membrane protein